jgi:hypothetical protein
MKKSRKTLYRATPKRPTAERCADAIDAYLLAWSLEGTTTKEGKEILKGLRTIVKSWRVGMRPVSGPFIDEGDPMKKPKKPIRKVKPRMVKVTLTVWSDATLNTIKETSGLTEYLTDGLANAGYVAEGRAKPTAEAVGSR